MINQLNNDILKAVGVRYTVNPELGHKGVVETEEMCQKTIAKLKWLDEKRPRVVLMADPQNKDTHAVMVRALGEKIAYIDMNSAIFTYSCILVYYQRSIVTKTDTRTKVVFINRVSQLV